MTKGILVIAQNNKTTDYVEQACALAMSLQIHNNTPISIITNNVVPTQYTSLFDNIIPIPFTDEAQETNWKIENRWKLYHASPYDETIVMDTDMLVLQNIDTWWDFLSNYELFFVSNVLNYRGERADTSYYRKTFIENNLPNLFSGLHYFKKCDFSQQFYFWLKLVVTNWEEFYEIHLTSASRPKHMSIDVCAAIVTRILDCEDAITNNIVKFPSFIHMKAYCQGWAETQSSWQDQVGVYISKNASVKIGNYAQTGLLHYTENDFLQKSEALQRYKDLLDV